MYMFLASSDSGVALLLTCVAVVVTVGLGLVFAYFIKRNVEHFKEEDEVIADNVYFGDSKRDDQGASAFGAAPASFGTYSAPSTPASDFAMLEDDDAQLPF